MNSRQNILFCQSRSQTLKTFFAIYDGDTNICRRRTHIQPAKNLTLEQGFSIHIRKLVSLQKKSFHENHHCFVMIGNIKTKKIIAVCNGDTNIGDISMHNLQNMTLDQGINHYDNWCFHLWYAKK